MESPKSWKVKTLGELLDVQNGYAFASEKFSKHEGIPLIRIRDLKKGKDTEVGFVGEYNENYIVKSGDFLVGMDGEFRCYQWQGRDALLNQRVCRLINFSNEIDPEFVFYGINNHLQAIENDTPYVTVKHLSAKKIKNVQFAFPNLTEQRRIVARIKECMERVDEIEGLRSEVCSEADKLQSAVFADFINSYSKDQSINDVLGDVIVECKYGTSKKANTQGKGYPILRMGNIQAGKIDITALKHIDLNNIEKNKYLLQEGDIVINRTNSLELVGKSAVFSGLSGEWIYASYLIRLRLDHNKALPKYVNAVINSSIGRNYVFQTARRAIGMVNINAQEIKRMPLPLPSIKEQEELVLKLNETEPIIDDLLSSFNEGEFAHLRESILRKAFAGEL